MEVMIWGYVYPRSILIMPAQIRKRSSCNSQLENNSTTRELR